MNKRKIIRVFEAFAGYGGASFGLKRSGYKYRVVGMSGFQLAEVLRKEKSNQIPIIFLTAKSSQNDLLTGFSAKARRHDNVRPLR